MIKLKPIALAAMGCGLLTACSAPPASHQLALQPVVRGDMPGNQAASWNRLARFHHERGQLALALGAYAQSLALDANQLEARNAVAVIEAQRGDLELARKALVALVKDYPGEAQPHTNLGYVQFLMGDNAGAAQTLRRAMALGAGPKAFQNLQLAEAALGKSPAADAPQVAASAAEPAAPAVLPPAAPVPSAAPVALAPAVMPAPEPSRSVTIVPSEAAPAVPVAAAVAQAAASSPVVRPQQPPLTVAPLAAAKPSLELGAPETPTVSRSEPQQITVLPDSAREIANHMELVKLAGNVYELKARVAAEPAAAPVKSAAPIIAAATPQPAAPVATQSGKVRMARLEVANGNGVTGMARRFRNLLGQMGIPVERLSNDKPFRQVATTIQYSPGFEKQAASLQKALQGKVLLTSKQLASSDVRLVLGKDARVSLTAATEAAGLSLVAMQDDSDN
jgi:tetratricopeptide (TPR) repeat protein